MTASRQLVQRLRNYCSILRDDGLSYGDYVELRRLAAAVSGARHAHSTGTDSIQFRDRGRC